jgi:hypothetical protein
VLLLRHPGHLDWLRSDHRDHLRLITTHYDVHCETLLSGFRATKRTS